MFFHNVDYPIFLAIAVAGFWLLGSRRYLQLGVVFALSCLFYMSRHPSYLVLILGSTVIDYVAGRRIATGSTRAKKRFWLVVSLVFNLGMLGFFKYYNFLNDDIFSPTLAFAGASWRLPKLDMAVPVGISFYTFQTLSYTIDVYRGELKAEKSFVRFGFFVTYFPQLVSGPIVRASEFLPQSRDKIVLRRDDISRGSFLFAVGLIKKVAVGDYLQANIVNRVFEAPDRFSSAEVVVALYAFTMQIYCDFSGYTDMARGAAKFMGLHLPENFDRPYQATNPADFWRRWHMTLSRWLRDYLYFPLGGSRVPDKGVFRKARPYLNLWLTMFIIGVWHGAGWTFVVYGAIQGFAMVFHRFFYKRSGRSRDAVDGWPVRILKIFVLMQFVVFSRILFRASSWENASDITEQLMAGMWSTANVDRTIWIILVGSFAVHYLPKSWMHQTYEGYRRLPAFVQGVAMVGLGMLLSHVATSEALPYIYDQF